MGKNILKMLWMLLLLHALTALGLIGYGLATGRFTPDRMEQYLATWQGEKLVPPPEEEVEEEAEEDPQAAAARIAQAEIEQEILTRELLRQIQLLRDLSTTVSLAQQGLTEERSELAEVQRVFDEQVQAMREESRDAGFQAALDNYSRMNPRLAKDDFMQMTNEEAVRYLRAMRADVSTAILERFRTPEEQSRRVAMLQLLERGEDFGALPDVASNN
ncbi:MAG: hypothetical protein JW936_05280 [Sedimentisphaerales bacterium]|nr:hypothetical protein [Sedimentisphaerales bacterium]